MQDKMLSDRLEHLKLKNEYQHRMQELQNNFASLQA